MSKSLTPKPAALEVNCASPPCFACEMDAAYAGFLPDDELAAALTRLATLAELAPVAVRKRWWPVLDTMVRSPSPSVVISQTSALPTETALALYAEARALLPRIADDRIHAALKRLLESNP